MIGHASDEIALRGELSFKTEKQLPLYVSGATTIGELMAHPVTAPIIGGLMQNMQGAMGVMQSDPTENVEDTLGTGAEMMYGMPLKSLASFAGAEMAAQIELMIQGMNQALGNK